MADHNAYGGFLRQRPMPKRPPLSDYDRHRAVWVQTGDEDALRAMLDALADTEPSDG